MKTKPTSKKQPPYRLVHQGDQVPVEFLANDRLKSKRTPPVPFTEGYPDYGHEDRRQTLDDEEAQAILKVCARHW